MRKTTVSTREGDQTEQAASRYGHGEKGSGLLDPKLASFCRARVLYAAVCCGCTCGYSGELRAQGLRTHVCFAESRAIR